MSSVPPAQKAPPVSLYQELPETSRWLIEGGDSRIALNGKSGRNRYGCCPYPDPDLLAFGSCTASVVSEDGFAAANRLRKRLLRTGWSRLPLESEVRRQTRELAGLLDLSDLRPEIIMGASGTDMHRLAGELARKIAARPLGCVMVERSETGSGIPEALAEESVRRKK